MKQYLRTTSIRWTLPLAGLFSLSSVMAQNGVEDAESLRSGEQLVQACGAPVDEGNAGPGRLCEGYLLGFLQGNPAVVFSEELPSAYMQRALRTRAPVHETTRPIKSAKFCLAGRDSVKALEAEIGELSAAAVDSLSPSEVILHVLERHYRCLP